MKTTDNAARKHPIAAVRKLHAISEHPALSKRLDVALLSDFEQDNRERLGDLLDDVLQEA
jgi:hypothetical protein